MITGAPDVLEGAGAEFSLLVCAIVCRVSAAVFTPSTASWYCLYNVFNAQQLVMWPSSLQYAHDVSLEHHLLLVWEYQ